MVAGPAAGRSNSRPYFEDLEIGYSVTSGSRFVSREEIMEFAGEWDPQPFHLDEDAARGSLFGRLVGSGTHTFAITMRHGVDCGVLTGNSVAGLGVDKMKFHKPMLPGSSLAATFVVGSLRNSASKPRYGIVRWLARTMDENKCTIFSVEFTTLHRRRPAAEL